MKISLPINLLKSRVDFRVHVFIYLYKILTFLVLPVGLTFVVLFGTCIYVWRRKLNIKYVLTFVTLFLYLCANPFISHLLLQQLEKEYIPSAAVQGDLIAVLGGGALNGTPDIEADGGSLGGGSMNRLIAAIRLEKRLHIPIIVSGEDPETAKAKEIMLDLGVLPENIIIDDQAHTTVMNAEHIASICAVAGFKKPIIVTSAYHMPRAVLCFKQAGMMDFATFAVDYQTDFSDSSSYNKDMFVWLPTLGALKNTTTAVREYMGIAAMQLQWL